MRALLALMLTILFPFVPARYHDWIAVSKMPTPVGVVIVKLGLPPECARFDGCLLWRNLDHLDTTVYIRPSLARDWERHVFMHELGHVIDYRQLTSAERADLTVLLRLPLNPWWGGGGLPWGETPAEQFAEFYADCAIKGAASTPVRSDGKRICAAIRKAVT